MDNDYKEVRVGFDEEFAEISEDGWKADTLERVNRAVRYLRKEQEAMDIFCESADIEIDRLTREVVKLSKAKEDRIEKYRERTEYVQQALMAFMETMPTKKGKTQESLTLACGKIVKVYPSQTMKLRDEMAVISTLRDSAPELIKSTESVDWSGYKKRLQIVDNLVVDTVTGAVVDGVDIKNEVGRVVIK